MVGVGNEGFGLYRKTGKTAVREKWRWEECRSDIADNPRDCLTSYDSINIILITVV